ncbi:HAD family hydrolase [Horticoccus luteus]|uniref:phosphoglycolate phosphatase n=1 Tax=Horticoccus luteus TaxID=2862869 RepID=A0A8F9TXV8_9BACT|nr:HAD family hydrolase [Horticoccus luteus]QYM79547.1 HAD family hydrolase [Horticoccus luteus]
MSAPLPFHTFLFDLDGTLLDQFDAIHQAYAHTLPQLGLPAPTPAQVRAAVGGGVRNAMLKFVAPNRIDEALAIYMPYWNATMLAGAHLFPGARELLADLHARGAKLAVLTNKAGHSSREICTHLDLDPLLDGVFGADDTPWLKPDPALVTHVLARLERPAAGTVLVGDSIFDVAAAANAGLACWCVTTGTHTAAQLHAAGPARVFPDLPALHAALGAGPASSIT